MNVQKSRPAVIMTQKELYKFVVENPEGTKLPENPDIIVRSGLGLAESNIFWLPENLTVVGHMNIEGSNIRELPANLLVGGDLCMYDTHIKAIPAELKVYGDIHAEGMNLDFPDRYTVIRSLYLNGRVNHLNDQDTCPLKLPKSLSVFYDLDISNRLMGEWPVFLNVMGTLTFGQRDSTNPKQSVIYTLKDITINKHQTDFC